MEMNTFWKHMISNSDHIYILKPVILTGFNLYGLGIFLTQGREGR